MSDKYDDIEMAKPAYADEAEMTKKPAPAKKSSKTHDVEITTAGDGTTKKVKLDLEVDTSVKDLGPNPYAKVIHLARAVDSWRIFPRIFITTYIFLLYKVVIWFMELPQPNLEQSGLVSIVVGAGAAWFGLYLGSGKRK